MIRKPKIHLKFFVDKKGLVNLPAVLKLSDGVMAAQQILVLLAKVRVLVGQQNTRKARKKAF